MSARTRKHDPDAVAKLFDDLQAVKLHAGDPSLGELEKRSAAINRFVSKTTFSRGLAGTRLPKWSLVETFLLVCDIDEQEIAAYWKPRWVIAAGGSDATGRPGAQHGHICPACGTVTAPTPYRPQLSVARA